MTHPQKYKRKQYRQLCNQILWREALQERLEQVEEDWLKFAIQNQIKLINESIYGKRKTNND